MKPVLTAPDAPDVPIRKETDIFQARVQGKKLAWAIGFTEIQVAEIEIVISELGTNILKHGGGEGMIRFGRLIDAGVEGIQIEAVDRGAGIPADWPGGDERNRAKTTGSLGIGLSGIRRLMDECEIIRNEDAGALVRTRKWRMRETLGPVRCSVLSRPRPGEDKSGDDFFLKKLPAFVIFGVIDALGHGPKAHVVARQVVRILEENFRSDLAGLLERCHQGCRGTRGAAIALGRINLQAGFLEHIAVGNVETRIYGPGRVSRPAGASGTLGLQIERARVSRHPYRAGACVIMFSDGISDRFRVSDDLLRRTPQEIALHILSDFGRRHDDATVMVVR